MRFIHLAEVALGAVPDRGFPWSSRRREEIREAFRRVIASIEADPVDLLYLAGTLVEGEPLQEELTWLAQQFAAIPDTRVCLQLPFPNGVNSETALDRRYRKAAWPANVVLLTREELAQSQEALLMSYRKAISGHSAAQELTCTLEPLGLWDVGPHGYVAGEVTEEGKPTTRFVPCGLRHYHRLVVRLNQDSTQKQLEQALASEIESRGKDDIYQIVLKGTHSPQLLLLPEKLLLLGNVLELRDESLPEYDLKALHQTYGGTLLGDYMEGFAWREVMAPQKERTLYLGIQALLETSRYAAGKTGEGGEEAPEGAKTAGQGDEGPRPVAGGYTSGLDLGRAIQILKMTRKGRQSQRERHLREIDRQKTALAPGISRAVEELEQTRHRRGKLEESRHSQRFGKEGGTLLAERVEEAGGKRKKSLALIGSLVLLCLLASLLLRQVDAVPAFVSPILAGAALLLLAAGALLVRSQTRELKKRQRLLKKWQVRNQKLLRAEQAAEEDFEEKARIYARLKHEYREYERLKQLAMPEDEEICCLTEALEKIEALAARNEK